MTLTDDHGTLPAHAERLLVRLETLGRHEVGGRVSHMQHMDYRHRAEELADHLRAVLALNDGNRYASALVVLRTALEHHLMDPLIFLSRLYVETSDGIKQEDVQAEYARLAALKVGPRPDIARWWWDDSGAALFPFYTETPAKLQVLDELLREIIEVRGEKALVWSWFRFSLATIVARYSHYGLARVDGSVASIDTRNEANARFQTDPNTRLFVGNAAAAGAGLTLTAGRTAFTSPSRTRPPTTCRASTESTVEARRAMCPTLMLVGDDTVEENEYERLVAKRRGSRELLGDRYDGPPSRLVFLAEIERGLSNGPSGLDDA